MQPHPASPSTVRQRRRLVAGDGPQGLTRRSHVDPGTVHQADLRTEVSAAPASAFACQLSPRSSDTGFAAGSAPNVTSRDARRGERRRQLTEPHLDEPESRGRGNPDGKLSLTEDPPKSPRIGQTRPDSDAPTPGASTCPRISLPHARASEHRALTWRGSVSMGRPFRVWIRRAA
jgi:hypothetical protein